MNLVHSTGADSRIGYSDYVYSGNGSEIFDKFSISATRGVAWHVLGSVAATALSAATPGAAIENTTVAPKDSYYVASKFASFHAAMTQPEIRLDGLISNIVSGATPDSGVQLANFFKAMPQADRFAVLGIIQDVQKSFSDSILSLELEHNFDYETSRNQLFVSVETNLDTKDILERRKFFNKSILSNDAKKAASKYTITTFF